MVRVLFQATTLRASLAQELYATLFSQGKPGNLLGTTWGWARPYECWEGYSWPARGGWPASLPKGSHHRPGLGSGESSSKYLKAVRFFWWIFIDFAQKTDKIHLVDICFQLLVTFSQDCFSGGCCSLFYTFQWISGGQWANAGFAGPLWFWGRWNDCNGGCFRPRHILGVTAFLRRQVFPTNGFEQFLINYCPLLSQESCASYSFQHAKSVVKKSSDANHGAKKGF